MVMTGEAIRIGADLGDVRFSMMAYGVAVDVDIEAKRDIFRFATADPWEDVKISVSWNSHLSRQLMLVVEQFK